MRGRWNPRYAKASKTLSGLSRNPSRRPCRGALTCYIASPIQILPRRCPAHTTCNPSCSPRSLCPMATQTSGRKTRWRGSSSGKAETASEFSRVCTSECCTYCSTSVTTTLSSTRPARIRSTRALSATGSGSAFRRRTAWSIRYFSVAPDPGRWKRSASKPGNTDSNLP